MTITERPKTPQRVPKVIRYESERVVIPQYSRRAILAIWLAAALPMGVLSWVVAPRLADTMSGTHPLVLALMLCLTAGLIWQFVLVVGLVGFEQRSLRWTTLCDALWLRAPRSPRTGRVGGRIWWIVIPLLFASAAEQLIPAVPPVARDFGLFLDSHAGHVFFHGAWGWFAVMLTLGIFNTVLGEERDGVCDRLRHLHDAECPGFGLECLTKMVAAEVTVRPSRRVDVTVIVGR